MLVYKTVSITVHLNDGEYHLHHGVMEWVGNMLIVTCEGQGSRYHYPAASVSHVREERKVVADVSNPSLKLGG